MTFDGKGAPPLIVKILPPRDYADTFEMMKQHCLQRDANTPDEVWLRNSGFGLRFSVPCIPVHRFH